MIPAVSGIAGNLPLTSGAIAPGIHGLPLHGMVHPHAAAMGLPIAGAAGVGALTPPAGQGLMMHPGGIQTAMGIIRAPPMMAGIAGTPAPPLPPGAPFGHPMPVIAANRNVAPRMIRNDKRMKGSKERMNE